MAFLIKRFTAPMPGGEKTFRLFVPGFVASLAVGIAGFVWLLSLREWASAFGGIALGLALNVGFMGLFVSPNKKLFDEVDRAVETGNDRALALTVWFEAYFLHAAKALTIFLALASPILLLRGGEGRLLPAALLGLCLADPPQGFLTDETGDKDWHATFLPFCQLVPVVLAVAAGVWRLPLWSLVGPYALVVLGSAAVMARFNLRRYRAKMAAPGEPAKPTAKAKPGGPAPRSVPASPFSPDELVRLASIPGARLEVELKEVPRKKKRLPPGAFRAGGEVHSASSTPASRRHSNRRPKGRH